MQQLQVIDHLVTCSTSCVWPSVHIGQLIHVRCQRSAPVEEVVSPSCGEEERKGLEVWSSTSTKRTGVRKHILSLIWTSLWLPRADIVESENLRKTPALNIIWGFAESSNIDVLVHRQSRLLPSCRPPCVRRYVHTSRLEKLSKHV